MEKKKGVEERSNCVIIGYILKTVVLRYHR
jgi:hypothetical protein